MFLFFLFNLNFIFIDSFPTGSFLPPDKGLEVCVSKLFLTGSILPLDKGLKVGGYKLFLGGWFVCSLYSGLTWVGKL